MPRRRRRYFDMDYAGHNAWGGFLESNDRGFYRLKGSVATGHGYVEVVALKKGTRSWQRVRGRPSLPIGGEGPVTRFWFIWRGRQYARTYPRILTHRGAARVASRFAREIARRSGAS